MADLELHNEVDFLYNLWGCPLSHPSLSKYEIEFPIIFIYVIVYRFSDANQIKVINLLSINNNFLKLVYHRKHFCKIISGINLV